MEELRINLLHNFLFQRYWLSLNFDAFFFVKVPAADATDAPQP